MDFKEGVAVYTPDGRHLGNVDHLVVDPRSRRVTHIVVRQGHLLPEDKVIAVEQLSAVTDARLVLDAEPEKLVPFEESHYVTLDAGTRRQWGDDQGVPLLWAVEHDTPLLWGGWGEGGYPAEAVERITRNIPQGDVAVAEGATVEDSKGEHVGRVLELVTDPQSGRITCLVVEAGHLWGKHTKAIPINWVSTFGEWKVTLAVGVETLDKVPACQPT
jgi:uncharacterized protein YrrD